jgi:single-strand DNA-binding protein
MTENLAILVGHLGQDPELKYTQGGKAVCNFTLATGRDDQVVWHNIVAWEKTAEIAKEYLHRGSLVYVRGRIVNRSYDDRDGNKKYVSEIVAFLVVSQDKKVGAPAEKPNERDNKDDDDLPF